MSKEKDWNLYILRCRGGTLYTGIAKDIAARVRKHKQSKGAAYTRTHLPVKLVYQENGMTRSQALIREAQIKRMARTEKLDLVKAR